MKLWIDDVRYPPDNGWEWATTVNLAKAMIQFNERLDFPRGPIELISMDHDAGDYVSDGGDYIKLLDWLEETGRNYPIRIHSMNPVGRENMRAIIRRNGWTEVI